MAVLVITGTSTDVGKTIATAAIGAAVLASGRSVAACKPGQTGVGSDDPGDIDDIVRLTGITATVEAARYPEPLAPETAATRAGMPTLTLPVITDSVDGLTDHDLVLVEGAGGVLVRLGVDLTILDVAAGLSAPVVVVAAAGLGTLNHTELTVDAIRARGIAVSGIVIGSWPAEPDLATRCNRDDLPRLTGVPVVGVLPAGAGAMTRAEFTDRAPGWFDAQWVQAIGAG